MTVQPAASSAVSLDIQPLTGALGCEIFDVDLSNLDDTTFAAIYQAFLDYSVVVFRDQELTQEQFAEFGKRFGKLEDEPFIPYKAEVPGVFYFKGAGGDTLSAQYLGWHMDHTYQRNPSLGAMLYAIDVPSVGGDTAFASNYLSYESLSPAMQQFLADKTAIHDVHHYGLESGHFTIATVKSLNMLAEMREKYPQVEHPLICTHPETGRKMLYLNQAWTVGIKQLHVFESRPIIAALNKHALQEKFKCRVRWRNKSLLIWDNRCVQHSQIVDYREKRSMWRLAMHTDWEPA